MKIKNIRNFLYATFYRQFVKVHWTPRENALAEAITKIDFSVGDSKKRLFDYGCGEGSLSELSQRIGLNYVGIDVNPAMIEIAKEKYSLLNQVDFQAGTSEILRRSLCSNDIVCLNGVAHHLDDAELSDVISIVVEKKAILIILDHRGVERIRKPSDLLPKLLQYLDFGNFVRSKESFEFIGKLKITDKIEFEINFLGVVFWPLFCWTYTSVE